MIKIKHVLLPENFDSFHDVFLKISVFPLYCLRV